MWSAISKGIGAALLVSALVAPVRAAATPGQSISGTIPAASDVETSAAAGTPTATNSLREDALSMGREMNAERDALTRLARDFELKQAQIQVLKADKELSELQTSVGIKNEQGDLPQLVGVFKMPKRQWAEFLVGTVVLSASVGDWVTAQWRVQSLLTNGVELASRGGERRTLLFGNRSTTAAAQAPEYPPMIDPAALQTR